MKDWFRFIERLGPSDEYEMTSLVTAFETSSTVAEKNDTTIVIPIDWWIHVGGVIRDELEHQLNSRLNSRLNGKSADRIRIRLDRAMKNDPVLKFEMESWLQAHAEVLARHNFELVHGDDRVEISKWTERLHIPIEFISQTSDFLDDMRNAGTDIQEPPWILWNRFGGWMKRRGTIGKNLAEFEKMDRRLAFLRVALSSQDEVGERASLKPFEIMVNPTFEISETRTKDSVLMGFARNSDVVAHRSLSKLEAHLLDHARESFRIERTRLMMGVAVETGVQKEFVKSAIDNLESDGFLLENTQIEKSVLIDQ